MRLKCHLHAIRGSRPLRELAEASGVNRGELSKIENGRALPKDEWIPAIEEAYGAPVDRWYDWRPPQLVAVEVDEEAAVS